MTLIVAIPCEDGLVVSADKRVISEVASGLEETQDAFVKLHSPNPFAAYGLTGNVFIYDKEDNYKLVYDLGEVLKTYYQENSNTFTHQSLKDLARHLETHFKNFLSVLGSGKGPPTPSRDDKCFYELLFWYVTEPHELSLTGLKMKYVKELEYAECLVSQPCNPKRFQVAEALAYSHTALISELKKPSNPRFDRYRNDHRIMRFLKDPPPTSEIDTDEALYASKRLIKLSSKWIHQVSSTSDSILIHKHKGVLPLEMRK